MVLLSWHPSSSQNCQSPVLSPVITILTMAKSKYEYVREFETEDKLLPNVFILVRIDGKGFHK